ncbi:hypothetical protein [Polycladospora coralii]|uniref:hypothetical protein n=1 Tax=Polycladospora coralii TaxID=2771432 RepID=UPI001BCC1E07|nr:hypothetical protein [Polycladospora coralii]
MLLRLLILLCCFILLTACETVDTGSKAYAVQKNQDPNQKSLEMNEKKDNEYTDTEEEEINLEKTLADISSHYETKTEEMRFTMQIASKSGVKIYTGTQNNQDWSLHDPEAKQILIESKDGKIDAFFSGQKETLTPDQIGLVSPLEHLTFIQDSLQSIRTKKIKSSDNAIETCIEITIDHQRLSDKLKDRLTNDKKIVFDQDTVIKYEIYYQPKSLYLTKLNMDIAKADDAGKHDLTYTIQN